MEKSMKVHFIAVSQNAETGPRSAARSLTSSSEIVSAPIDTLLDASNDPDVPANGYVTEIEYPKRGKPLKIHGSPRHFSETPAQIGIARDSAHTTTTPLQSPAQIQCFRERKII